MINIVLASRSLYMHVGFFLVYYHHFTPIVAQLLLHLVLKQGWENFINILGLVESMIKVYNFLSFIVLACNIIVWPELANILNL